LIATTAAITVIADDRYGYLDLTDDLRRAVKDAGVTEGMVVAFCAHTTCALLINEWEEGALADFRRHLTDVVPHEGVYYQRDDFDIRTQNMHEDEPKNGHAHVKAMLLSAILACDPGERWRTDVRRVAAADPLRDGRAEGPRHHLQRGGRLMRWFARWGARDPSGSPRTIRRLSRTMQP
jgi:thiamine phosphate synthase YjbQ (UPF0047 family)